MPNLEDKENIAKKVDDAYKDKVYKLDDDKDIVNENPKEGTDTIDEIIKNHEQIYLRVKPKAELKIATIYDKIINDLSNRYDSMLKLYRLKMIDGLLIDYSKLSDIEKETFKQYLTEIYNDENTELFVEGLNKVSF
ncbi:MAG: hypothetical protein PWP03_651 [Candidatus Woesearchaeota archaeon]|nr:hypothetical protein [Candidatus Woesearchaeota archaeon]MDN5328013.1 hypothetical protein [Candidatus Woesearchaeota archaeon]